MWVAATQVNSCVLAVGGWVKNYWYALELKEGATDFSCLYPVWDAAAPPRPVPHRQTQTNQALLTG